MKGEIPMRIRPVSLLAFFVCLPAQAQMFGMSTEVSGWEIRSVLFPDGRFYGCSAGFAFNDGFSVMFAKWGKPADTTSLTIIMFDEKNGDKGTYPVRIRMDANDLLQTTGITVPGRSGKGTRLVLALMPDAVFRQLVDGRILSVSIKGETVEKPLVGTPEAGKALSACVQRGLSG